MLDYAPPPTYRLFSSRPRPRIDDIEHVWSSDFELWLDEPNAGWYCQQADLRIDVKNGVCTCTEMTLHTEQGPWTHYYLSPDERFREPTLTHVVASLLSRWADEHEARWTEKAIEEARP